MYHILNGKRAAGDMYVVDSPYRSIASMSVFTILVVAGCRSIRAIHSILSVEWLSVDRPRWSKPSELN